MTATLILVNLPGEAMNADLHWEDNSGQLRNWPLGQAHPDVPLVIPGGAWGNPDFDRTGKLIIFTGQTGGNAWGTAPAYRLDGPQTTLVDGHTHRWDVGARTVADVTATPPANDDGGSDVPGDTASSQFNLSDFVTQPHAQLVQYGVPDPLARPGVLTVVLLVAYKFLFGRRGWIA